MRPPRGHRMLSWLLAFAMLAQAMAFGWTPVAEAAGSGSPDDWVICTAHDGDPAGPASDDKSPAHHDLNCGLCQIGCVMHGAVPAAAGAVPVPAESGRVERATLGAAPSVAAPFTLANARAPPRPS